MYKKIVSWFYYRVDVSQTAFKDYCLKNNVNKTCFLCLFQPFPGLLAGVNVYFMSLTCKNLFHVVFGLGQARPPIDSVCQALNTPG